jgi:myo-inositol-1(or 4)-monophosphatase
VYDRIKTIAISAGPLFLEGYTQAKKITYKSAVDLVTDYDVKIELYLKEKLAAAFPEHTLVGEETSEGIIHPDKAIYIDPIDGTTNFVHGIPFCAISIGVWEGGKPVAGVVYNPVLDELFFAEKGKGAYCNDEALQVSGEETLERSLMATGFPYTKIEQGEDFRWAMNSIEAILPYTRDIRRLGSAALDLCYVARGTFEGYFEINLKPWDVAAGILMVKEAGGSVSRHDGQAYTLDERTIVASNGRIQDAIVEKIR